MAILISPSSSSDRRVSGEGVTLRSSVESFGGEPCLPPVKGLRRGGGAGSRGEDFVRDRRGGRGNGDVRMPRHRDGDEVGHAAPKIGETNVGFRMLAQMGWAEGERIGSSMKGIENPLTAIIKTTKAGLGASK